MLRNGCLHGNHHGHLRRRSSAEPRRHRYPSGQDNERESPTTRKFELPGGESILLTDTVGFIRKLPHHLIKAFRSTLDEAVYADILIIVIDASDPEHEQKLEVTEQVLADLGAAGKPTLYVFNKCDLVEGALPTVGGRNAEHQIHISALTGSGYEEFAQMLESMIQAGKTRVTFVIPNAKQGALNTLYKMATVEDVEYGPDAVRVTAVVDAKVRGMLREFDPTAPQKKHDWE